MNVQEQLNEFDNSIGAIPPICNGNADPKQKHTVALLKRLADWFCNDDKFRELFRNDPAEALKSIQLDVPLDAAVILIKLLDEGVLAVPPADIPEAVKMYYG